MTIASAPVSRLSRDQLSGYRFVTRSSSYAVSGRPSTVLDRSSAPSRNAARPRRSISASFSAPPALVEPDAEVDHRGQLVLAGPRDRLGSLASTGMPSTSRPGPAPGSGVVGRRPDSPPFREQLQDVERGALALRGVGHGGRSTCHRFVPPALVGTRAGGISSASGFDRTLLAEAACALHDLRKPVLDRRTPGVGHRRCPRTSPHAMCRGSYRGRRRCRRRRHYGRTGGSQSRSP